MKSRSIPLLGLFAGSSLASLALARDKPAPVLDRSTLPSTFTGRIVQVTVEQK